MIFKQIDEILSGRKTQTRRIAKPEHTPNRWGLDGEDDDRINEVIAGGRSQWVVGKTYAIVPKRGMLAIQWRIRITAIRMERLQDIYLWDAMEEGVASVEAYRQLWESINGKTAGARWEDNPLVWVIKFEVVR